RTAAELFSLSALSVKSLPRTLSGVVQAFPKDQASAEFRSAMTIPHQARRALAQAASRRLTSGQLRVPKVFRSVVRSGGHISSSDGLKLARDFIRSNHAVSRGRRPIHISDMPSMSSRLTYGAKARSASESVSPASQA